MDEIRKCDIELFVREAFRPLSILRLLLVFAVGFLLWPENPWVACAILVVGGTAVLLSAYFKSVRKRFRHERFGYLWKACKERREKLRRNLAKIKKHDGTELIELQRGIERTMPEIYRSLRRADLVLTEIQTSEAGGASPVAANPSQPFDPQAQELYRVADRNLSEYRHFYRQAMSGVERAEAQVVVFSTTLDTFRIRLLNTMIAGRSPEAETREFLNVVAEAKMQFAAIDRALEEIEFMPFPREVTTLDMDPAIRAEIAHRPPPPSATHELDEGV